MPMTEDDWSEWRLTMRRISQHDDPLISDWDERYKNLSESTRDGLIELPWEKVISDRGLVFRLLRGIKRIDYIKYACGIGMCNFSDWCDTMMSTSYQNLPSELHIRNIGRKSYEALILALELSREGDG
jgi:hypothetical protein